MPKIKTWELQERSPLYQAYGYQAWHGFEALSKQHATHAQQRSYSIHAVFQFSRTQCILVPRASILLVSVGENVEYRNHFQI